MARHLVLTDDTSATPARGRMAAPAARTRPRGGARGGRSTTLAASRATQARLDIDTGALAPYWRLDEHTCEVGRRGIAQARAALRGVRTPAA